MKHSVKVEIFGHDYILKADADDGHIKRVAELVDAKMKEIAHGSNINNVVTIAILAAITIGDEYFRYKDERERFEEKARGLTELIDEKFQ